MNEFLTDHLQQNMFENTLIKDCSPQSLRFYWHLLRPNWSIIRVTASLETFGRIPKLTTFSYKDS